MSGVTLQTLYSLNGAIMGYTVAIVFPIWLHLKCIWYDRSSGCILNDEDWNRRLKPNKCGCLTRYSSRFVLYIETAFLVVVIIAGLVLLASVIYGLTGGNAHKK
jgi:hypothetical protein